MYVAWGLLPQMIRRDGWEARLAESLRAGAARPYDAKKWNCARFAHCCAEAAAGRALPFRRKPGGLEACADAVLPRVAVLHARRGDVVLANVPAPSLGVCLGRTAAFLSRSGLMTIPMRQAVAAWSV